MPNEKKNLEIESMEGFLTDCFVDVLRADCMHPIISGNKIWKLDLNLQYALREGYHRIASFGGAFSNHIHALAYTCHKLGLESLGFIRLHALDPENPTLQDATRFGMCLHPLSAKEYTYRSEPFFLEQLQREYGEFYMIPEGGHNELGIAGVTQHLQGFVESYDFICAAVGSGTTVSGLRNATATSNSSKIVGIPVVNLREAGLFLPTLGDSDPRLQMHWDFHWGGYGRVEQALVDFCNEIYRKFRLPLEPIYTGKLFYAVKSLHKKGHFPVGSRLLLIHSGGLQGARALQKYRGFTLEWTQNEVHENLFI